MIVDNVEVRESSIRGAGKGVFALRDFKEDEIVCFYDGKVVKRNELTKKDLEYALDIVDNDSVVVGDPNYYVGNNCGHMINDAGFIVVGDPDNPPDMKEAELIVRKLTIYNQISSFLGNVYIDRYNLVRAYKDIKCGDELFFPYGLTYYANNDLTKMIQEFDYVYTSKQFIKMYNRRPDFRNDYGKCCNIISDMPIDVCNEKIAMVAKYLKDGIKWEEVNKEIEAKND